MRGQRCGTVTSSADGMAWYEVLWSAYNFVLLSMQGGTDLDDYIHGTATTNNGSIVLAGYTRGNWARPSNKSHDGYLDFAAMAMDAEGLQLWSYQAKISLWMVHWDSYIAAAQNGFDARFLYIVCSPSRGDGYVGNTFPTLIDCVRSHKPFSTVRFACGHKSKKSSILHLRCDCGMVWTE